MHTRRAFARLAAGLAFAAAAPAALADAGADIRALYLRFLAAQNDRDLVRVRATLWDSPEFLWVSDGRPVWGPEAVVERMRSFQKAEVWRVEPDLDRGRVVQVAEGTAYLSLPLTLVIGNATDPARLKWLVGVLCRRQRDAWQIAALFTTEDKGLALTPRASRAPAPSPRTTRARRRSGTPPSHAPRRPSRAPPPRQSRRRSSRQDRARWQRRGRSRPTG